MVEVLEGVNWRVTWRADPVAARIADRHYNRQKIGAVQYVPPGRCVCLVRDDALWVTSWPLPEWVKHEWPGAWVNSLFRNEGAARSSALIRAAVSATRARWSPPSQGIVSFVDPRAVPGVLVRGVRIFGYCYMRAGFRHVGFTKEQRLWAWQMLPNEMPPAAPAIGATADLFAAA